MPLWGRVCPGQRPAPAGPGAQHPPPSAGVKPAPQGRHNSLRAATCHMPLRPSHATNNRPLMPATFPPDFAGAMLAPIVFCPRPFLAP